MKKGLFLLILLGFMTLFITCGRGPKKPEYTSSFHPGVFKLGNSITFVFQAPRDGINDVTITGDFNNWARPGIPLNQVDGLWTITLVLEYGIYQYKFIMNGTESVSDPNADAFAPDSKGGKNSIVEVKKQ